MKFHPNRKMGRGSKIREKLEDEGTCLLTYWCGETTLHPKMAKFETSKLFSNRNFVTGFGISSVGIREISPYTKSEQPRVAGKHLTKHAKNGYAAVGIKQPCFADQSPFINITSIQKQLATLYTDNSINFHQYNYNTDTTRTSCLKKQLESINSMHTWYLVVH